MIGRTLGHFRILEKLGSGGMGEVYRAHDQHLERDVAIKVLPPGMLADDAARKRFRQEALTLSRLNHPNVATVHDFVSEPQADFLVMECVTGTTLGDALASGPLAEKDILAIGMQLAEGLAAAHEQGVIHCDLKPGNLRVTPDGRLKILDFGLARFLGPVGDSLPTQTESLVRDAAGTLPYMAPEQLNGSPPDARSDLYAAGAVLYEMATGQRLFPNEREPQRQLAAILHQAPRAPTALNPHISPGLEGVILKCLEKAPEHRYQSAREILADLRRMGASTSLINVTASGATRRSRRAKLAGAIAAAAAAMVLAAGWWFQRGHGAGAEIHSLAVIPLRNLSGDPQQEYFADGMTEALITDLGRIRSLRVVSRTSVMQYKNAPKPVGEIAQDLNLDAVVEGSVLRSGSKVQITARLVEARTDTQIWSQSYERDLQDVLSLQSEVARTIAAQIRARVTVEERQRLSNAPAVNPAAQEAYLQGRYYWNKRTPADLKKGLEFFQQAIAQDPNYAPAYAGAADSYILMTNLGVLDAAAGVRSAKAAAQKAIELDSTLAEAHASLGIASLYDHQNWRDAERELKLAIELNPNYATAYQWYSNVLAVMGRPEGVVENAKRAQELDPLSPIIKAYLGWAYYVTRKYDEAIAQTKSTLQVNPEFLPAHLFLGLAYSQAGRHAEAIEELRTTAEMLPGSSYLNASLGYAYAAAGKKGEARKILRELLPSEESKLTSPADAATIYAGLGEKEAAIYWLEKSVEEGSLGTMSLKLEPMLDNVRPDPKFAELMRRAGLPSE